MIPQWLFIFGVIGVLCGFPSGWRFGVRCARHSDHQSGAGVPGVFPILALLLLAPFSFIALASLFSADFALPLNAWLYLAGDTLLLFGPYLLGKFLSRRIYHRWPHLFRRR